MKWFCALTAVVCLGLGACGPGVAADTIYDDGDQGGTACPIPPTFNGPGQTGDACSDAEADCAPTCCSCASGVDSYWASECSVGECTDPNTACADAFNSDASLCSL